MKTAIETLTRATAIGGISIIALAGLLYALGARVNTTKSIPVGLYWTSKALADKGAYVMFCPPESDVTAEAKRRGYLAAGFCPGDFGYMMKKIVATEGDFVTISNDGVSVNGVRLPLSIPLVRDRAGRSLIPYPATRFIMRDSEVMLMSDVSATSFDSRYFGPVSRSQIRTVISPVLVMRTLRVRLPEAH
jgi:conjugative transfer signal peptidase TraF